MNQAPRAERGFAMFEILISLLIATLGVVAMAGLQGRAASMELEANQRTQALVLLQDISERLAANRPNAAAYVATDLGTGPTQNCAAAVTLAERDSCEWANRLRGAAMSRGGRDIGAMVGARGCIGLVAPAQYVVTIAWQGTVEGPAPTVDCGRDAYGNEALRRAVSTVVRIADLDAL